MSPTTIRQVKSALHKFSMRTLLLAATATIFTSLVLVPRANAQVAISITPPSCAYGYYSYAPYGCAPSGFYGPGYFYNGIFLGIGPWANWGYGHGWGEHRFNGAGGGRYVEGRRDNGGRAYAANRGGGPSPARARAGNDVHGHAPARDSHAAAAHARAPHAAAHATAAHGGESHGAAHAAAAHGGASHGGEEHH